MEELDISQLYLSSECIQYLPKGLRKLVGCQWDNSIYDEQDFPDQLKKVRGLEDFHEDLEIYARGTFNIMNGA